MKGVDDSMRGSAEQEHASPAASAAIWRGIARRRDRPNAGAVTAAARRDIRRGSAQHSKEETRKGAQPQQQRGQAAGPRAYAVEGREGAEPIAGMF